MIQVENLTKVFGKGDNAHAVVNNNTWTVKDTKPKSGPKTKEQKRVEAERRNAIYAATHQLKDRLGEVNQELAENNAKMKELLEVLADPDFYTSRDDAQDVIMEHAELKQKIKELEEE